MAVPLESTPKYQALVDYLGQQKTYPQKLKKTEIYEALCKATNGDVDMLEDVTVDALCKCGLGPTTAEVVVSYFNPKSLPTNNVSNDVLRHQFNQLCMRQTIKLSVAANAEPRCCQTVLKLIDITEEDTKQDIRTVIATKLDIKETDVKCLYEIFTNSTCPFDTKLRLNLHNMHLFVGLHEDQSPPQRDPWYYLQKIACNVWHVILHGHRHGCLKISTRQRIKRELKYLKLVSSCPRVPKVLWSGICSNDEYGFVMDVIGQSLDIAMMTCQIDQTQLKAIADALIETLQCCHSCGIIHRDVKPSNIVLCDSVPYLIDFDCATDNLLNAGFAGTRLYCSDSVLQGEPPSFDSDFESLCYTLYAVEKRGANWSDHNKPSIQHLSRESEIVAYVLDLIQCNESNC